MDRYANAAQAFVATGNTNLVINPRRRTRVADEARVAEASSEACNDAEVEAEAGRIVDGDGIPDENDDDAAAGRDDQQRRVGLVEAARAAAANARQTGATQDGQ